MLDRQRRRLRIRNLRKLHKLLQQFRHSGSLSTSQEKICHCCNLGRRLDYSSRDTDPHPRVQVLQKVKEGQDGY